MNLGDRIKTYEKTFSYSTLKRMPLMIRVDGRAFHTFTRVLNKPFDSGLITAMVEAALYTAKEMQGFKAAYVQSDEATFCLTDYDTLETEGWFTYKLTKVISISAAIMSVAFNRAYPTDKLPVFDSRAFTVPKEDVVNAFVWRSQDWKRNILQMYCQSIFSHSELHRKNQAAMHEMLHQAGKNWATDLSDRKKNGTFLINTEEDIVENCSVLPSYESINATIGHLFTMPC